jgi:hypothetical protein
MFYEYFCINVGNTVPRISQLRTEFQLRKSTIPSQFLLSVLPFLKHWTGTPANTLKKKFDNRFEIHLRLSSCKTYSTFTTNLILIVILKLIKVTLASRTINDMKIHENSKCGNNSFHVLTVCVFQIKRQQISLSVTFNSYSNVKIAHIWHLYGELLHIYLNQLLMLSFWKY